MDIVSNFNRFFKRDYFYIEEGSSELELIEEKDEPYKVTLKITRSGDTKFLVIKDIEKLKLNEAKYLKEAPQDCDYIIIDLIKKEIYLIELKKGDKTNVWMMEQLIAGEKWLKHILFCCQCDDAFNFIDEWVIKRVGIKYQDLRPPAKMRPHKSKGPIVYHNDVLGYPFFKLQGKEFNIDSIYPI